MKGLAAIFYIISVALIVTGFVFAFHYGDYNEDYNRFGSKFGHIVGGDAYNYIIIGIRGVIFAAVGLVSAIIASTILVIDAIKVAADKITPVPAVSDKHPVNEIPSVFDESQVTA